MRKSSLKQEAGPEEHFVGDILEEVLRQGAREMLQRAIENEVDEYLEKHQDDVDETGRRLAVRNGYLPERELLTGIGPMRVKQPRVDNRRLREHKGEGVFSSNILPRYLRRIPSIDNLIPALYLKGISTGDFTRALSAILGEDDQGLSATNIVRLKAKWEDDYRE